MVLVLVVKSLSDSKTVLLSDRDFRVKFSKFPAFLSLTILKLLIHQLAGHLKGTHILLKDKFCEQPKCTYALATAYPSDLKRHLKGVHGIIQKPKGKKKTEDQT